MKKEEIRKEFFKLKNKGHTNNQCRKIIFTQFSYEVCKRTLQRWNCKLNKNDWNLCDKSKRPKTIHYKITPEIEDKYCFAVIDDCSRYNVGLFALNRVSTNIIIHLLDTLFKIHGKPREILTDNGNVFGLKSKHSKFDRALNRRGIKHIRTAIHSPTTSGKIERFFQTLDKEFTFCNKDAELFRMRYNHFRPHTSLEKKTPAQVYFDFSKLF